MFSVISRVVPLSLDIADRNIIPFSYYIPLYLVFFDFFNLVSLYLSGVREFPRKVILTSFFLPASLLLIACST